MLFLILCLTVYSIGAAPIPEITTTSATDATTENYDKTDLAQEMIDEALNIDYGRYTTQEFSYQNSQKARIKGRYNDTCIESYINCVMNQIGPTEVCAFSFGWGYLERNRPERTGYWNAATYCDVYFDNCRRGYRVWRIIGKGFCKTQPARSAWKIYNPHRTSTLTWGPRPVWTDK